MRAPPDTIPAPPFPAHLKWLNVPRVRLEKVRGRPILVEFWDCRLANSLRTLPYMKAWHARYAPAGLQAIGIHSPVSPATRERAVVQAAVKRLGIAYPVLLDPELEMWGEYENRGWPARYLFDGGAMLFHYHYGEGAYRETELAIQELLEIEGEPLASGASDRYTVSPTPAAARGAFQALVGASSPRARVSSSRSSLGSPSSSTSTAPPGQ